jgi:hypothetical protein
MILRSRDQHRLAVLGSSGFRHENWLVLDSLFL